MFAMGRPQYGQMMYRVSDEDTRLCLKKFKNRYWGKVDAETWAANDAASLEGNGEIKALYVLEDGKEIHFVRLADCSYTAIGSDEDVKQLIEHFNRPRRRATTFGLDLFA